MKTNPYIEKMNRGNIPYKDIYPRKNIDLSISTFEKIDWINWDIDKILEETNIDEKEGFHQENKKEKINGFNNDLFYQLDKEFDKEKGLYELKSQGQVVGRWNFIISNNSILIKYVEKFTDNKGFGTLMFKDFLTRLKTHGIINIKTEIDSPEVTSIFEKLKNDGIINDTEEGYIIN